MKRFLSVFLSVCMIMSCVSFAAPSMVNTGMSTDEAVETESFANADAYVSAETIKVNFVGDIATEFASINASVGDTLDLSDYLDVEISDSAKAEHKRFNGWMPDGAEKLLTTDTVTVTDADGDGEMYLVALVNHDFNFALEANRDMWYSAYPERQTVSAGSDGKTLKITGSSTFTNAQVLDGTNGADFKIDTTEYKGLSIYYANNYLSGSTPKTFDNCSFLYGAGVSHTGDRKGTWISGSSTPFSKPDKLPGWDSSAALVTPNFDMIKDTNGTVLYCGVPITVDNSSKMLEDWTDTVNSLAVAVQYGSATFEVRYIRFLPHEGIAGLNVWTGTTEAYDFENADENALLSKNWPTTFETMASANNENNTAAQIRAAWGYVYKEMPVIERDRPIKISFDYIYGTQIRVVANDNALVNNLALKTLFYNTAPSGWQSTSSVHYGTTDNITDSLEMSFHTESVDVEKLFFMIFSDPTNGNVYLDNIKVVPGYKVNYNANGGNGSIEPDYFMEGTFSDFADGSALSYEGKAFKGWSLTKNGNVVTSVTGTPGFDVTLYAVWDDLTPIDTTVSIATPVAGETAQTTVSGTGYTGTISWSPALTDGKFAYSTAYTATVTLNVAEGYTASGVAENGYTVANATVTNTAGATTFTAAFAATEAAVAKPGLNLWTGTTDAYTFDGAVQSDFAAYGGAVLVEGTDPYMNLAGNFPHFTLKNTYGVVDKDRPVKATFKVLNHASAKDVRIIRNVTNNLNPVLEQHIIGVPGSWSTLSSEILGSSMDVSNLSNGAYTDNTQNLKNLIIIVANDCTSGNVYVDDVSFVPAYKLTYDVNGGNGSIDPVYFFGNTYSTLADGSSLTSDKGEFAGWSLTKDGAVVSSITATPGSDITLYAVWKDFSDMDAFTYELTSNTPGVADGIMTFVTPSASHTNATVYLANEDGIMTDYTEFAKVNFTTRIGTYEVSGNRAFAMGATQLHIYFSCEGAENVVVEYDIPEANRLTEETPLYKYFVVSDLHLGGSANNIDYFYMQWQSTDPIRTRVFGGGSANREGDIFKHDADFIIVNGDLVNYGSYDYGEETGEVGEERYWNVLDKYLDERLNNHNIPVFITNGNHEFQKQNSSEQGLASFIPVRLNNAIMGQVDYLEKNYGEDIVITRDETNPDALYYAADMMGAKYIFMSTPEMSEDKTGSSKTVSEKQLKFVEEQLYDGANSGKTLYVITHLPINSLTNSADVNAILAKHPNTIVFNSHTHYDLAEDKHYTVVGDMTTSYTTSDTSAASYIEGTDGYITSYNAGQFVEVYEDKVIIKGRMFDDISAFFGHAMYIVETPAEGDIQSVAIDGKLAKGNTLTAVVNGSVPADDASYTYEWIIEGETVSTEKTFTVATAGVKVALRVTDEDGCYASVLSDVIADYNPQSYNISAIRTDAFTGIRFKASVTKQQKKVAVEYGFIVTRSSLLGDEVLTHNSSVKYVEGINYGTVNGEKIDKIYEIVGDDIFFTAVVYNIPKTKDAYTDEFIVRPFTKVDGEYYYGDSIERSVYSVAKALRDDNYASLPTEDAINTVKEILAICEA